LKTIQATSKDALYKRILGDAWTVLDQSVREFHTSTEVWKGFGLFTVRHGASGLASMLARRLGLPAAGENIPVRLTITTEHGRERWHREFAGRPFITYQRECVGDILAEEFGPTEVWYQLSVSDGALVYRQIKSALRVGHWRIPIPGPLFLHIAARESAVAGRLGTHVQVQVTLPLIGLLVSYEGHIEEEEMMP
jgi:hypothetical protein